MSTKSADIGGLTAANCTYAACGDTMGLMGCLTKKRDIKAQEYEKGRQDSALRVQFEQPDESGDRSCSPLCFFDLNCSFLGVL